MAKLTMQEESGTPSTPPANNWSFFFKPDGLYSIDDLGNVIGPYPTGAGLITGSYTLLNGKYQPSGTVPSLSGVVTGSYTLLDGRYQPTGTSVGSSFWTLVPGSPVRASNTTFTMTGDYSSITAYPFGKGMIYKWLESGTMKTAMQSIPQTYSAPNTTVTFVGDTMLNIDVGTLKYAMVGAEAFLWRFAVAGTIGATGVDVANARYAEEPMRVLGSDLQVGTAGTTNSTTVDINKNGTTMFTAKPTLASTVASSPTPFTADSGTSLALGDKVTIDQDAVQTTAAIDEYISLYVYPVRYLYLS